jgi:hypothetical protein
MAEADWAQNASARAGRIKRVERIGMLGTPCGTETKPGSKRTGLTSGEFIGEINGDPRQKNKAIL